MVRGAPTFRDVAPRVAELLRGHVFVAHNATFDWRFVSSELGRSGCQVTGERLCTVKLARAVLPALRRRSLDALTFHYGIENHARHRAGGDALATARVLVRLLDAAAEGGCESLDDLRILMRRPPTGRRGRSRRRGLPGWSDGEITA
jgi:DNA polymerase-3 subunit epsilon